VDHERNGRPRVNGNINYSFNDSASIAPKPGTGTTHIFKWTRHFDFDDAGSGAGGGIVGVTLNDILTDNENRRMTTIGTAGLWIEDATDFTIRDCMFEYLKGTAVKVQNSTFCKIRTSRLNRCGDADDPDPAKRKAVIDIGGGGTQAQVWTDRLFIENNYWTHILLSSSLGALWHRNSYHEDHGTGPNKYVDGTLSFVDIDGCFFWDVRSESVVLGQPGSGIIGFGSSVRNSQFNGATNDGNGAVLKIKGTAYHSSLANLTFRAPGQTDRSITNEGASAISINNVKIWEGGGISSVGDAAEISDIYIYHPYTPTGQYALDVTGANSTINGVLIDGVSLAATCHGVRADSGVVSDVQVIAVGGDGITATSGAAVLTANRVSGVSGTPYVYVAGVSAWNNYPWQDGLVYRNGAASGGLSSTTETDFDKSYTIDSNRLRAGAVIRIRAQAVVTGTAGGGTLNLRLKIGNTVIQATSPVAIGAYVGHFDSTLIVRTVGASGNFVGTTTWAFGTQNAVNPAVSYIGLTAIDTTVSQKVAVSAQFGNAGNSVRLDILTVEIFNSGDIG
jgi:hypothetical protein